MNVPEPQGWKELFLMTITMFVTGLLFAFVIWWRP